MENDVYGQCPHGENMTTCSRCNPKDIGIELYKNDPRYCYFLEHKSGQWLSINNGLTRNPLKALTFDGDEGRVVAKLFLYLNQLDGALKSFKVIEYEFLK